MGIFSRENNEGWPDRDDQKAQVVKELKHLYVTYLKLKTEYSRVRYTTAREMAISWQLLKFIEAEKLEAEIELIKNK